MNLRGVAITLTGLLRKDFAIVSQRFCDFGAACGTCCAGCCCDEARLRRSGRFVVARQIASGRGRLRAQGPAELSTFLTRI